MAFFLTSLVMFCRFDPQVEGGESTFLDSFHVAKELRTRHPEDFESLVRIPATFKKIHFGRPGAVWDYAEVIIQTC